MLFLTTPLVVSLASPPLSFAFTTTLFLPRSLSLTIDLTRFVAQLLSQVSCPPD
ncbi:MAG: hypothetical protein ABFD20_04665 [Anaerolineales bacterium]